MKPQHSFVAERIAAQHCAELLRRGPEPAELLSALGQIGERIARRLAPALATLLGGDAPDISAASPEELSKSELIEEIGPLAANALLACSIPSVGLIASIDGQAVLRLVDRAFGGRGEAAGALPDAFPLSAELMVSQLETLIVESLSDALCLPDLRAVARNCRLSELARFPAATRLAVLRLSVSDGARSAWQLRITVPTGQLPELISRAGTAVDPAEPATNRTSSRAADPAAAPFADMPVPLTATLVDMLVTLSTMAGLQPGVVLPVAVARAVPVSASGTVIASGSVGSTDDRIAIKLTRIA
ncbi:MAG: FliM/FliN family flagellar motor switch protein [Novosphingobium sp.]